MAAFKKCFMFDIYEAVGAEVFVFKFNILAIVYW